MTTLEQKKLSFGRQRKQLTEGKLQMLLSFQLSLSFFVILCHSVNTGCESSVSVLCCSQRNLFTLKCHQSVSLKHYGGKLQDACVFLLLLSLLSHPCAFEKYLKYFKLTFNRLISALIRKFNSHLFRRHFEIFLTYMHLQCTPST